MQQPHQPSRDTGIDALLAASDGAHKITVTPSGKRVRQRPATTFELGDIVSRFPLSKTVLLGGGVDELADEDFIGQILRDVPGAACALVAASCDRPSDELVEKGLRHVDDEEFFPLLGGAVEMTFPLGIAGRVERLKQHLAGMGISLPEAAPEAPKAKVKRR